VGRLHISSEDEVLYCQACASSANGLPWDLKKRGGEHTFANDFYRGVHVYDARVVDLDYSLLARDLINFTAVLRWILHFGIHSFQSFAMDSDKLFLKVYQMKLRQSPSHSCVPSRQGGRLLTLANFGNRIGALVLREILIDLYPTLKLLLQQINFVEEKNKVDVDEQLVPAYFAP